MAAPGASDPSARKRKSNRAEADAAARLGGHRIRNSGARPWGKDPRDSEGCDIETAVLVVEHKRIEPSTKSMSLRREWLVQIVAEARRRMKDPGVVLKFEGLDGPEDWLLLPLDAAVRLLGRESISGLEK